ncbi:SGNH hydrolase [Mollisia scopiformis]|uniref:SGNH hydrolase n=1 Tax=Mollisia scopiformis TaxID=149040 RepID=A0A194XW31_MOLSC|nr:SGNH hydrolase [Mollisia scopiformis]KUJ23922.1 SGNH hydrolase [Mollisia scopiformis]
MASTTAKKQLRILCFGDSLTEGYSAMGWSMTPYSGWLETYLNATIDYDYDSHVETEGRSGDCVRTGFETRMRKHYPPSTTTSPYDWVVFLGGTNDMAYRHTPTQIFDSIKTILDIPLSRGAKVLIMTVPEIESHILDDERGELNDLINNWAREKDAVWGFDLWQQMKYHGITEEERRERWDDSLHFTPKGYEMIGEMVGARLVKILEGGEGDKKIHQ